MFIQKFSDDGETATVVMSKMDAMAMVVAAEALQAKQRMLVGPEWQMLDIGRTLNIVLHSAPEGV